MIYLFFIFFSNCVSQRGDPMILKRIGGSIAMDFCDYGQDASSVL